ncbi:MAG: hypothetical protein KAI34_07955, partial [Candidatus Lokiarchaeota archaeon]|nr:hypothetical protein [Candidatus Lokiarchaeota archaeon]
MKDKVIDSVLMYYFPSNPITLPWNHVYVEQEEFIIESFVKQENVNVCQLCRMFNKTCVSQEEFKELKEQYQLFENYVAYLNS